MIQLRQAFATDIGLKRQQNQDSALVRPELGLFVVADGMGGHMGGETASALAIETILQSIRSNEMHSEKTSNERMRDAIQSANLAIYDYAIEHPELQGMGTTVTALLFTETSLVIGQVGDSRCYFSTPNSIWQLTRDHSFVQEKLRAGLITREQLKTDRMKNVITRSVGFEPNLKIDVYEMEIQKGDVFLACSDGLSGQVEDFEIQKILQKNIFLDQNFEQTVTHLIQTANSKGGEDNVTIIVLQVLGGSY